MIKLTIFIVVLVFGIIGKTLHYLLYSEAAVRRKLDRNKGIRILDLQHEKKVQVSGKIVISKDSAITAPLTRSQCVWFKIEIERLDRGWELIVDEREMVDFEINDHTSQAHVIAYNLEVATLNSSYECEILNRDQNKHLSAFLKEKKIEVNSILGQSHRIRFKETWLPMDSEIQINGKCIIEGSKKSIKSDLIKPLYISVTA